MLASAFTSTEYPFDLLHSEMVDLIFSNVDSNDKDSVAEATSKLEFMGFRVGYALVESLCKETPRFATELDIMKFICKDFWSSVFRKQVDNLKTNHQGVYVVNDNQFWLLAPYARDDEWKKESSKYLSFSCGMIRGALSNLGITAYVTCETIVLPGVKFNIHTQQKI